MSAFGRFIENHRRRLAQLRRDLLAGGTRVHRVAQVWPESDEALTKCGRRYKGARRRILAGATWRASRCANCDRSERRSP